MSLRVIGKPTPLVSAVSKVTGAAKFTDDIRLARPLTVKILRSTHPSARIEAIDTTQARQMPGVLAVLSGADFDKTFGVLPISRDEPPLACGRVRYVGEPVAAVAAENLQIANRALAAIRVDYRPTEACLDPTAALGETDAPIHPELGKSTNLHKAVGQTFGDLDAGFQSAAAVVEGDFDFESVTHAFTEPHATQVEYHHETGSITVYSATQVPHYLHRALSDVLDLPMDRIRVIKPHLGGGFGGKSDPFPHEMIAAKMALATGRNTRICFDREEVFYSHHGRHATSIGMKLGLCPEKGLTAISGKMLIDGGAYASFGVVTTYYNGVLLLGPYRLPNFSFHCDRVYTNKPMCGAMRGHGGVNPRFASEVLLDMACDQLSIDPCDFRLANFLQPNSLTVNQFRITSVGIGKGLTEAMARADWRGKFRKLPYGRGIGVACGFFISGSALPIHWNEHPQSTVRLTVDYDGRVTIYSGAADIGQGSDTMLAQMVAEVLGIPISSITVLSADTLLCPIDLGSYSSRVTFMAGNAARNAAIRLRKQLVSAACKLLETDEPTYEAPGPAESLFRQGGRKPNFEDSYLGPNPDYADGFLFAERSISDRDGRSLPWLDVVRGALNRHGALQSRGVYISPEMGGTFKGAGAGLSPSYSFSAFIVEVEVDPATGFVRIKKVTGTHDCGVAINPLAVEGQLEGSIHMGLGQALMEGVRYKDGVTQNASFLDYKILSPHETPEIELVLPPSDESEGPFGAKEVGEGALAPVNPAVANAIYDAVGVRINSLPITPDKVLAAIQRRKHAS